MSFLKELVSFLKSREFFSGVFERTIVLLVCVVIYLLLIIGFLYKPAYLFYLIILGMVFMAGFMLYLMFPEFREKMQLINNKINHMINKMFQKP